MAALKIICNLSSKLYVDQEFVSELQADKLFKMELSSGAYLVDVVSIIDDEILDSFDLILENDDQQVLKRIDLVEKERLSKRYELKSEVMRKSNMIFDDLEVIEKYIDIGDYGPGYYVDAYYKIKKNNKYGMLDKTGKLILDIKYDEIKAQWYYYDVTGFFAIIDQKCGYFTTSGEEVMACDYDSIEPLKDLPGHAITTFMVTKNGKKALFVDGFITDFNYDSITVQYYRIDSCYTIGYERTHYYPDYVYLVSLDGINFCVLNAEGKLLLKDIYDSIDMDNYDAIDDVISFWVKKEGKEYLASGLLV